MPDTLHNKWKCSKGFSARNLRLMIQFVGEYPAFGPIWQRAVAQLTWAHNVILIQKVKDLPIRQPFAIVWILIFTERMKLITGDFSL